MNKFVIDPILKLGELIRTQKDSPHVRLYRRTLDGDIHHVGGSDLALYGGAVPLVGDILSIRSPSGYAQYSVQQRLHVDAVDRTGWALMVEPIKDASLAEIAECWQADTEMFEDAFVDCEEELREEIAEMQRIEHEKSSIEQLAAAERKAAAKIAKDQRRQARLQRQAAPEKKG